MHVRRTLNIKHTHLRAIASLVLMAFINLIVNPTELFALSGGPSTPEMGSFQQASTTEMVDLFTGDFKYNIPLLEIDGYPVNLSYTGSAGMEQEASWTGLGWNLNPGMVNRTIRGVPDDFSSETIVEKHNMKKQIRMSVGLTVLMEPFGFEQAGGNWLSKVGLQPSQGLNLTYSTKRGFSIGQDFGMNAAYGNSPSGATISVSSNAEDGLALNAGVSLSSGVSNTTNVGLNAGVGYSSRSGFQNVSYGASLKFSEEMPKDSKSEGASARLGGSNSIPIFGENTYFPHGKTNSKSTSISFAGSYGGELAPVDGAISFRGAFFKDEIDEKEVYSDSYGYLYLQNTNEDGKALLDFNIDGSSEIFYPDMTLLPPSMLTYDIYNISGQGYSGAIRPKRAEMGAFAEPIDDPSISTATEVGGELTTGNSIKTGTDAGTSTESILIEPLKSIHDKYSKFDSNPFTSLEQNVSFIAGIQSGHRNDDYFNSIFQENPVQFAVPNAETINEDAPDLPTREQYSLSNDFQRVSQDEIVSVLTTVEAEVAGLDKEVKFYSTNYSLTNSVADDYAPQHIREIIATKNDGSRYVYGIPVRNMKTLERNFNASGGVIENNRISYTDNQDSTINESGNNHLFYSKQIPEHAYAYLITGYLGSDYIDVGSDGITDDDIGTAVKFNWNRTHSYGTNGIYRWRIPMTSESKQANYNTGENLTKKDEMASYTYGEKEVCYLHSIVTKNHIAFFEIGDRQEDGMQAIDKDGGIDETNPLKQLNKIKLYSKKEWENNSSTAVPIKTIKFTYDNSLCSGITNGSTGKLTLTKVEIYYGNDEGGALSPYEFSYNSSYEYIENGEVETGYFNYSSTKTDKWGNYRRELPQVFSENYLKQHYPYVNEHLTDQQLNEDAGAWLLNSITLPSGGKINIEYEADEYAFVQDKRAQALFEIRGAGGSPVFSNNDKLHSKSASTSLNSLYVYIDNPFHTSSYYYETGYVGSDYDDLIEEIQNVYFKCLIEIPPQKTKTNTFRDFEYIRGYFQPEQIGECPNDASKLYVKMKSVEYDETGQKINPIVKAGLDYAYTNHQPMIYGGINPDENAIVQTVKNIISIKDELLSMFSGPYGTMSKKGMCQNLKVDGTSFIRLNHPTKRKKGGGHRVKSIVMSDEWSTMTASNDETSYYGQEYYYDFPETGLSSGVAAYEPSVGNDENPFRKPHYYKQNNTNSKKPQPRAYQEEPMGEIFYPSAVVGYAYVKVVPINQQSKSNRNYTVNEFYTAKEFPFTHEIQKLKYEEERTDPPSEIAKLGYGTQKVFGATSQGHVIILNDMHGKTKSVETYLRPFFGEDDLIQSSEFHEYYSDGNQLINEVPCLTREGALESKVLGVSTDIDIYSKQSKHKTSQSDGQGNLFNFLLGGPAPAPIPVSLPFLIPKSRNTENGYKTSVVTKLIQKVGIVDKITYTDKSISTVVKNELFDEQTGRVIQTSTTKEYHSKNKSDVQYSTNYPAYFSKDAWRMGFAYRNIGYKCIPDPKITFMDQNNYDPTYRDQLSKIIYKGYLDGIHPALAPSSLLYGGALFGNQVPAGVFVEGDEVIVYSNYSETEPESYAYVSEVITESELDDIYDYTDQGSATNPLGDPTPGSSSGSSSGTYGTFPETPTVNLCGTEYEVSEEIEAIYEGIVELSANSQAQSGTVLSNIIAMNSQVVADEVEDFNGMMNPSSPLGLNTLAEFHDVWSQSPGWSDDFYAYCQWMLSNGAVRQFLQEVSSYDESYSQTGFDHDGIKALLEVLNCSAFRSCLQEEVQSTVILNALDFMVSDHVNGDVSSIAYFMIYLSNNYEDHYFAYAESSAASENCTYQNLVFNDGNCLFDAMNYIQFFEDPQSYGGLNFTNNLPFVSPCDNITSSPGVFGLTFNDCNAVGAMDVDLGDISYTCPAIEELTEVTPENGGSNGNSNGNNVFSDPQDYSYNEPQTSEIVMFVDQSGNLLNLVGKHVKVVRSGLRNQQSLNIANLTSFGVQPLVGSSSGYLIGYISANASIYSDDWVSDFFADDEVDSEFNPFLSGHRGVFRLQQSYVPIGNRTSNPNLNARKDGMIEDFTKFWNTSQLNSIKPNTNLDGWVRSDLVNLTSFVGPALQSTNAIDIPSSEIVGLNNQVSAVANNAEHKELLFESFEDYNYGSGLVQSNSLLPLNTEENFSGSIASITPNDVRTELDYHSGKASIFIKGNTNTGNATLDAYPTWVSWSLNTTLTGDDIYDNDEYRVLGFKASVNEYWVSFWVKPYQVDPSVMINYLIQSNRPTVELSALNGATPLDLNGQGTPGNTLILTSSGRMIDGWVRVEGTFKLTTQPTSMDIKFVGGEYGCFIDDFRLHPKKSNMKSFVYDTQSQRLRCTLDENNYGTFYKYDEAGNLSKVEKETIEGRLTIRESGKKNSR